MNKKAIGVFGYLLLIGPLALNFLAMSYYLMRNLFRGVFFDMVVVHSAYGQVGFGGFYEIYFLNAFLVFILFRLLVQLLKNAELQ